MPQTEYELAKNPKSYDFQGFYAVFVKIPVDLLT